MLDDQTYGFNKADAGELINLIGSADSEHSDWHNIPSDGSSLVAKSPGGGIAARSGTTVSSATCTVWQRSGTTLSATTQTITVYNLSTTAVGNTVYIVATMTNIGWVAVWEDC